MSIRDRDEVGRDVSRQVLFFGLYDRQGRKRAAAQFLAQAGGTLEQTGVSEQRSIRVEAVIALARNRRAALTASDVSASLGIGFAQADALLTELAKKHPDLVAVEIDDKGGVFYRVDDPKVRIGEGRLEREIDQAYAEAAEAQPTPPSRSARVR